MPAMKRKSVWIGAPFALALLSAAVRGGTVSAGVSEPAGAEAYYQWLTNCMDEIEKDLPAIVRSAEVAARIHTDGWAIGIVGEVGFQNEGLGRCGGLMSAASARSDVRVRLTGLVDASAYNDKSPCTNANSDGCVEIGFGSKSVLDGALARGAPFDFAVDNHAAEHNGLFPAGDGKWVAPTVYNANIVALWTWTGEFAAACTRLGKMPLMFQGFTFPGGEERALKLGGPEVLKYSGPGTAKFFHDEAPERVEAGTAGHAYLREVRTVLEKVRREEMRNIHRAATAAADALRNGRAVYLIAEWHAFNSIKKRQCNADYVSYGPQPKSGAGIFKPGDVVFSCGYAEVRTTDATAARAAGAARGAAGAQRSMRASGSSTAIRTAR
jgi:hypothetical protein